MSKAELRKAAVLLMTLSEEQADRLLARLSPGEIEAVTAEMARVESLEPAEQEAVMLEFAEAESARSVQRGLHGDCSAKSAVVTPPVASKGNSQAHSPFAFLHNVAPSTLADALAAERPQTIALVASHVPAHYGAQLVAGLQPEQRAQTIRAAACMRPIDASIALDVAAVLAESLTVAAR